MLTQVFRTDRQDQFPSQIPDLLQHQHIMHFTNLLLLASSAAAISLPGFSGISQLFARKDGDKCPAVWSQISKDLTQKFLTNGQCNPDARAAIRAVFHDCGGQLSCSNPNLFY
jgi:hypothetical protein